MKQKNSNLKRSLNRKLLSIFIITSILILHLISSIYLFAFKDTSKSYSLTQSYKSYFGVEDWNLSKHAIIDIDSDGTQDMITYTNCAFLSSVSEKSIPLEKQCIEPTMSSITFHDNNMLVGQRLISSKPFKYNWLRKSYLVKTQEDIWKFYDLNGLQFRTFELDKNNLFIETNPSIFDSIDLIAYQSEHLGIMLFLSIWNRFLL